MAFEFINGQWVNKEGSSGLGSLSSGTTATTTSPNTYSNMYFGNNTADTTVNTSDYIKPSNSSMFGDIFGSEGFGLNKGTMQGLGSIGQIGSGIGQLFLGAKQMGLAEDKFEFDKDMLNKQYAMAKENYDRQKARSESIGSQMQSGKVQ